MRRQQWQWRLRQATVNACLPLSSCSTLSLPRTLRHCNELYRESQKSDSQLATLLCSVRVERRKRGNAQRASSSSREAEGDRELSSAGMTTRGRRPRVVTVRELSVAITFGQVLRTLREFAWPLSVRSAYTILSDEDIEIGGLSDFNYCWHVVVGGTGKEVQVEGGAGVRGAEPPDCHETTLKCFINKFCHEMRHDLWR